MGQILCLCALEADRNQIRNSLQDCIWHWSSLQRQTANRLGSKANCRDRSAHLGVRERCPMERGLAQLFVQSLELQRASAKELARMAIEQHDSIKSEDLREFRCELLRQW